MKLLGSASLALNLVAAALAAPGPVPNPTLQNRADSVTVALPSGTVIGTASIVETFNGIPFADPPVGPLRLKPPTRLSRDLGTFDATGIAAACPQMPIFPDEESRRTIQKAASDAMDLPMLRINEAAGQEDCLTISVQRPRGTTPDDRLPVLFWIYGGGFVYGSTQGFNADKMIEFAAAQGQEFIFVAVNYRVAGFGFLGGAEILRDGSANLGLLDQRMGLEWVADNIASFGGDPEKVTIWGQSAGAISVFDQMLLYDGNATYNGKSLFRGAIMNSGAATPTDPVDCPKAQAIYDTVVERSGCGGEDDTLECLRGLPYEVFLEASNSVPRILSYTALALSYLPRPDGTALTDSPDVLASEGRYHAVPMIIGDQEDEGTIFSFAQTNLTSTEAFAEYLSTYYFAHSNESQVTEFVNTYPPESPAGSPFRTGEFNEFYNDFYGTGRGFKRVAALLGDIVFTLARRLSIEAMVGANPDVPVWSYLNSFHYSVLPLNYAGTAHGSDVNMMFEGTGHPARSSRTYYFNFLHNQDPNVGVDGGFLSWPRWTENKKLLWIQLGLNILRDDDFRAESYRYMKENTKSLYF